MTSQFWADKLAKYLEMRLNSEYSKFSATERQMPKEMDYLALINGRIETLKEVASAMGLDIIEERGQYRVITDLIKMRLKLKEKTYNEIDEILEIASAHEVRITALEKEMLP
jgi:hypothetical protein